MAQYLKDGIRARIDGAALRVFARQGIAGATMADIAAEAGISAGNIYHYYATKAALLDQVVPPALVRRFERLVARRVAALAGVRDVAALDPASPFHEASAALMDFAAAYRLELVIILGRSADSPYAAVPRRLVAAMRRRALAYARAAWPGREPDAAVVQVLDGIYRQWVVMVTELLAGETTEQEWRAAVAAFARYHLAGLAALLAPTA